MNRQKTPNVCAARNRQGFLSPMHTTLCSRVEQRDNSHRQIYTQANSVRDMCAFPVDADKHGRIQCFYPMQELLSAGRSRKPLRCGHDGPFNNGACDEI